MPAAWTEIHHVISDADGGPTHPDNGLADRLDQSHRRWDAGPIVEAVAAADNLLEVEVEVEVDLDADAAVGATERARGSGPGGGTRTEEAA